MANCYFIRLQKKISEKVFERLLRQISAEWFELKLAVKKTEWADGGPVWLMYLPDSAPVGNSGLVGKAPGEDFGFTIALQNDGKVVYFRHHGLNHWESWARGCAAELFSEKINAPLEYGTTGIIYNPGVKSWRRRRTFIGYAARNMKKPLSKDDLDFLERTFINHAPKGWE
jgi:hypothetical protein